MRTSAWAGSAVEVQEGCRESKRRTAEARLVRGAPLAIEWLLGSWDLDWPEDETRGSGHHTGTPAGRAAGFGGNWSHLSGIGTGDFRTARVAAVGEDRGGRC